MHRFLITVCTEIIRIEYSVIAACSAACAEAAYDMFGACSVSVRSA